MFTALVVSVALSGIVDPTDFRRGDANSSGSVDATDGVFINNFLFNGGPAPDCDDAADANDDGSITVTDSSYIWNWLFLGGPIPPAPGPHNCGEDETSDSLDCSESC